MRAAIAFLVVVSGAIVAAQPGRPRAELTAIAESQAVHPGAGIRLALQVRLPDGIHVQADRPRDPLLIATALTLEPPARATLIEIAYPQATAFTVIGQPEPLAVFEQRFAIGAKVSVAADASDTLVIPGRFRYQACDTSTCFAPVTEQVRWTVAVVPPSVPTIGQFGEVFAAIKFTR